MQIFSVVIVEFLSLYSPMQCTNGMYYSSTRKQCRQIILLALDYDWQHLFTIHINIPEDIDNTGKLDFINISLEIN